MLSYFRINDPYRLIGLLVVTLIMYIALLTDLPPVTTTEIKGLLIGEKLYSGGSMYSDVVDLTAPLTAWMHQVLHFFFDKNILARHILALILIFAQAIYLGIIFVDKKVYPETSFFPSLIFVTLFIFSFDNLQLSGELVASLFLLFALYNLLREVEFREESLSLVLKIGVYTGIASLFALSYLVYVPGALVVLLLFTRSSARKFTLLTFGFLIPHLLLNGFFYVSSDVAALWKNFYLPNLSFYSSSIVSLSGFIHLLILPCTFVVIAVIFVNRESRFTKYQSQLLQVFFFWILFCFMQAFYSKESRPHTFISLIPPFTFFISHFLLAVRKRTLAELALWLLLGGVVAISYNNRYTELSSPAYSEYVPLKDPSFSGEKLLVLSDDLYYFKGNSLATPFLNLHMLRDTFSHPEYYENVVAVYDGIRTDMPDRIIDPEGLIDPFMAKIPEFRKKYMKADNGYVLIRQ